MSYPEIRPRRLRRNAAVRRLVSETRVDPAELVVPMFVKEGLTEPRAVASLPGVLQHSRDSLRKAAVEAVQAGVGGIMLFGCRRRGTRPGRVASTRTASSTWPSGT